MALSLASISKKTQVRAPRMLLLGVEKIGKSSFATGCRFEGGRLVKAGLNSPIVLPLRGEEGVDSLGVPTFPTLNSFDEVLEALGVLYREDHPYKTVVIDSASALEPLVWDHVCREAGVDSIEKVDKGFGKGYTAAASAFRTMLEGLDALRATKNLASVIIGHVRVKRFDDPGGDSYDQYQFDVHEKAASVIKRWVDVTLFCNTKVAVKKEDQGFGKEKRRGIDVSGGTRWLYTQQRPAHPGGGRGIYGQLPYELPLDWTAFEDAVGVAINNVNASEESTS